MSLLTDRLKEAREQRGITQRELARICGLGENQINKYENGVSDPSIQALAVICRELGISTDYLLGLSDNAMGQLGDTLHTDESELLAAYAAGDCRTMLEVILTRLRRL